MQEHQKITGICYPGIPSPSSLGAFVAAFPIQRDDFVIMTKGWFKI